NLVLKSLSKYQDRLFIFQKNLLQYFLNKPNRYKYLLFVTFVTIYNLILFQLCFINKVQNGDYRLNFNHSHRVIGRIIWWWWKYSYCSCISIFICYSCYFIYHLFFGFSKYNKFNCSNPTCIAKKVIV